MFPIFAKNAIFGKTKSQVALLGNFCCNSSKVDQVVRFFKNSHVLNSLFFT